MPTCDQCKQEKRLSARYVDDRVDPPIRAEFCSKWCAIEYFKEHGIPYNEFIQTGAGGWIIPEERQGG
jgi:hypothetical protein